MDELRSDLEEDGQYTCEEIDVIINEYKYKHRSIHHRNFKTIINRVLGLNNNVIGEICVVLKELLKFYRTAFRFNIGFGCFIHVKTIVRSIIMHLCTVERFYSILPRKY